MRNTPTWEAVSSSASQTIGPVLLNPKVHYLIHNSLQVFPILNQFNSVYVIPAYFFKTHFTIIRQHTPRSQKRYLPFRLHLQTIAVLPPPHVCHIPRPSQHHLLPSYSWWAVYSVEHAILLLVMQYPVASCYLDCSARVRGERDVFSMQSSLTVSDDDGRDQLLSHPSGLTFKRWRRRVHSSLWRRMGGVYVNFHAFLRSTLEMDG